MKLVDRAGTPLKAAALELHENYTFLYPYISTPCLLLRLGEPAARNVELPLENAAVYRWPGGVGKNGDVVAYLAICTHALTYNGKKVSFLTYNYNQNQISGHARAITCCAHASIYDPASGAKVLGGPAPFPLAAVQLLHDAASDELTAAGLIGNEPIERFFAVQKESLIADFGRGGYRQRISGTATVLPLKEYSDEAVQC